MLINKSKFPISPRIVLADGSVDSVNIQPGGRVNLPAGAQLHSDELKNKALTGTALEAAISGAGANN